MKSAPLSLSGTAGLGCLLALFLLSPAGCSGESGPGGPEPPSPPPGKAKPQVVEREFSPGIARAMGREIAGVVEKVLPSVVVVRTEAIHYQIARDSLWGFLYSIPRRLAGQGSGVIISREGHVLTCNHVIHNAGEIEVVLHDGTLYPAKLVGRDESADLAVLKIDCERGNFTAIEPADSDEVRVGEFAIAIGSPFSLSSSVTIGIVSQKRRSVGFLPYENFIQTDASINPGNKCNQPERG